jgi:hypothetical protein
MSYNRYDPLFDSKMDQKMQEQDNEIQIQDKKLDTLGNGVGNLKQIAITIGTTIDHHNDMLSDTGDDIDNTTYRLRATTKRVQNLSDKTNSKCCCLILFLLLIIILLMVVYFM